MSRCSDGEGHGTASYALEAQTLLRSYESIATADVQRKVIHLIPTPPCDLLDIGAGTGRDAATFASRGHRVVAVEPTDELRTHAQALHPSARIDWVADGLPNLSVVRARGQAFDVVMMTAVWMHLEENERVRAMPFVAALVRAGAF
jgi:protein-L-isoaspartate O-methyltransferase